MKVYLAKCTTHDPETECPEASVEILGIFSTPKLAEEAFTRVEDRQSEHGPYQAKHQCWRGEHEVEGYEIDAWRKTCELVLSYHLGRNGAIEREYRPKKGVNEDNSRQNT